MEKFCIFCGKKPEGKSNEHIIPRWLIELTGNPKRIAQFGYKKWMDPHSAKRTYSFDSFTFPSCASCNCNFSKLEAASKPIVHKILSADSLSAIEFNTLLDWFDKIRIGLWLSYQYLDKNPVGITPKFHIERRIGSSDRMLLIIKMDGNEEGLNTIGCDMLSFRYTPSCFSLRVNNYCFLNISYNNLFSRRIGFPYPIETFMIENDQMENEPIVCRFAWGRNRVMIPLLKKMFSIHGTELYQPMFPERALAPNLKKFYDTKYVRDNSVSWEQGIGKVFVQDNTGLKEYPVLPSKAWIPSRTYAFADLLFEMQPLTLEWQAYVDSLLPSLKMLPKERKRLLMNSLRVRKLHNREMIRFFRKMDRQINHIQSKLIEL